MAFCLISRSGVVGCTIHPYFVTEPEEKDSENRRNAGQYMHLRTQEQNARIVRDKGYRNEKGKKNAEKSFVDCIATEKILLPGAGHINAEAGFDTFEDIVTYL